MMLLPLVILLVLTVGIIPAYAQNDSIPQWVKNTALWYGQGDLEDSEFINLIQYLIDKEIITVPNNDKMKVEQSEIKLEGDVIIAEGGVTDLSGVFGDPLESKTVGLSEGHALDLSDKKPITFYPSDKKICEDWRYTDWHATERAIEYYRGFNYNLTDSDFGSLSIHHTIYQKDLDGNIIASKDIGSLSYSDGRRDLFIEHPDFASCGISIHKVESRDCKSQDLFKKSKSSYDGIGCIIPKEYWNIECNDKCENVIYDRP